MKGKSYGEELCLKFILPHHSYISPFHVGHVMKDSMAQDGERRQETAAINILGKIFKSSWGFWVPNLRQLDETWFSKLLSIHLQKIRPF